MKQKTHVAIVLDKSGSMYRTKDQAISGYNEQIQQMKLNAKDQDITVSLVTFNGDVFEHVWNQPAETLVEADPADYVPEGGTAMRDAIGFTIKRLIETTDSQDENTSYLVIVISDGQTNEDKVYRNNEGISALKELIDGCQATGRWTFTYMGCSTQYLEKLSRETGISASNMAAWDNSTARSTTMAFAATSMKTAGYFNDRSKGIKSKLDYMNDEIGKVADFSKVDQVEAVLTGETKNDTVNPSWTSTAPSVISTNTRRASFSNIAPVAFNTAANFEPEFNEEKVDANLKNSIVNSSYEVAPKVANNGSVFSNSAKVTWKK